MSADVMGLAEAERTDLAALLADLSADQWDAPTLCAGWRVRDVVAHVVSYDELGMLGALGRYLRNGFDLDRANAAGFAADRDRGSDDILATLRRHLRPRGMTAMFGGRIALTDCLIHQQDIRHPLGLPRAVPAERLWAALDFARTARPIGAAQRVEGLTLTATDLGWSAGTGPAVEGPAESLLMAMAGRASFLADLAGPGKDVLAGRCGQPAG